jgi:hypothetical protein
MVGLSVFALRQQLWLGSRLSGDLIYRLFMSFYGLIFPAYVWICMVPIRGKAAGPTQSALVVMAIAIAVAAPMYWVGFINERTWWLIPAVAVVLVAKLFAPPAPVAGV